MHFLLTNDDGYDAPGLIALKNAVHPEHQCTIVAPLREHSRQSHASRLADAIPVTLQNVDALGPVHVVDATPADCVRLAVTELTDAPFDAVLSGINRGANISVTDVAMSATVAAAREAAILGLPAIAFSAMYIKGADVNWTIATTLTRTLLPQLLKTIQTAATQDNPSPFFWNVNYPYTPTGQPAPATVSVVPLSLDPIPLKFSSGATPCHSNQPASTLYRYTGVYESRIVSPGTDVEALFNNHITATPLTINPTADFLPKISLQPDPTR